MAYPDHTYRLAIRAALANGEQMVHTLHVAPNSANPLAGVDDATGDLATEVRNIWAALMQGASDNGGPGLAGYLHNGTHYLDVTCYELNSTGHAIGASLATFTGDTTANGTETTALPSEVACCVSLRTASPSRNGRGRLYLGGLGRSIIDPDGRFAPGNCAQLADIMKSFYKRVNNGIETLWSIDVFRCVVASPTTLTTRPIVSVDVGSTPDVQRRRRNRITEQRASALVLT